MSIDERAFGFITSLWKQRQIAREIAKPARAELEGFRTRLETVGTAILGETLVVTHPGLEPRSTRGLLVLPERIALFSDPSQNERMYWYRLLVHCGAELLGEFSHLPEGSSLGERANEANAAIARIRAFLCELLPRYSDMEQSLAGESDSRWESFGAFRANLLGTRAIDESLSRSLMTLLPELPLEHRKDTRMRSSPSVSAEKSTAPGSNLTVKTAAKPKVLALLPQNDNPLTHVFEKVLTADNYQGGSKATDGSDEAREHSDALSELTLDSIVRTGRTTESFVKSDVVIENEVCVEPTEALVASYRYPEWFFRERSYRQDWCALYEYSQVETNGGRQPDDSVRRRAEELKLRISGVLNQRVWKNRQKEGPELDVDALVSWWGQRRASGYQEQRIYCSRYKAERDLAILFLFDGSLSTDSWVCNRRVLDEIRRVIDLLGLALDGFSSKVAMASFFSESRHQCSYGWLKKFDESWERLWRRVESLRPQGYTRMGVALRHATEALLQVPARKRCLVVVTDAKPTDFDRYEGEHGNQDIRRAVQEALDSGIGFQAVIFSERVGKTFSQLFGDGRFCVVQDAWNASAGCIDEILALRR